MHDAEVTRATRRALRRTQEANETPSIELLRQAEACGLLALGRDEKGNLTVKDLREGKPTKKAAAKKSSKKE